jgi:beta-phosphoglucomutase family hydrolase
MSGAKPNNSFTSENYKAVLFDLDGVLTDTAKIHATCWKTTFDKYLHQHAARSHQAFRPFDIESDYRVYVDGKARYDGVRDFLRSRGIEIPKGSSDDPPTEETVCGLGNRKDVLVNEVIASGGVEPYEESVAFVRQLRAQGIQTAVVSSSHHCREILEAAKIQDLFEVRVDGRIIDDLNLGGKPAPDGFLAAAQQLGVEPSNAVVIEDALSGVQAGKRGGFGLVIGVARHGNAEELKKHGADLVVYDLGDLLRQPERGA